MKLVSGRKNRHFGVPLQSVVLENEVYIGNLVQGKRTTPNHKVKQTYVKPKMTGSGLRKIMSHW